MIRFARYVLLFAAFVIVGNALACADPTAPVVPATHHAAPNDRAGVAPEIPQSHRTAPSGCRLDACRQ